MFDQIQALDACCLIAVWLECQTACLLSVLLTFTCIIYKKTGTLLNANRLAGLLDEHFTELSSF